MENSQEIKDLAKAVFKDIMAIPADEMLKILDQREPGIMCQFAKDMESSGFEWAPWKYAFEGEWFHCRNMESFDMDCELCERLSDFMTERGYH